MPVKAVVLVELSDSRRAISKLRCPLSDCYFCYLSFKSSYSDWQMSHLANFSTALSAASCSALAASSLSGHFAVLSLNCLFLISFCFICDWTVRPMTVPYRLVP